MYIEYIFPSTLLYPLAYHLRPLFKRFHHRLTHPVEESGRQAGVDRIDECVFQFDRELCV